MDAAEKIIRRHGGDNARMKLPFKGNFDILFDGNKATEYPQWRDRLLVHELAQYCTDQR